MILDIVKLAVGAGTHIMSNRQKRKMLESDAALVHAEKMAKGEIEYQQVVKQSQDNGWKDEFVLILISLPILVLIWSIFSDDPSIKEKNRHLLCTVWKFTYVVSSTLCRSSRKYLWS